MKKLICVLKNNKGETMVEILVSITMFLLILGTLATAISFASGSRQRSERIKQDFYEIQGDLRSAVPTGGANATYSFNAISIDGSEVGTEVLFNVEVVLQTKTGTSSGGRAVEFPAFGTQKILGGGTP